MHSFTSYESSDYATRYRNGVRVRSTRPVQKPVQSKPKEVRV